MSNDNENKDKQQGGDKKPLSMNAVQVRLAQAKLAEVEKKLEPVVKELNAAEAAYDAAEEKAEAVVKEIEEQAAVVASLKKAK